jgi:uncharacterized protein YjbI with pentapeptide repeats
MGNPKKIKQLLSSLLKWFVVFLFVLVLVDLVLEGYQYPWTGFEQKTFWEWLELLIVPIVLTAAAYLYNNSHKNREHRIAEDNLQENELQTYFDHITELLLEKNLRDAHPDSDVGLIARANTLRIFRRLGKDRKTNLLLFLCESNLISGENPIISLRDVNLDEVNLSKLDLTGINLSYANLAGANLKGSILVDTDLDYADLQYSDLSGAKLIRASLNFTDLSHCNLKGSNLSSAELFEAKLCASDLRKATFNNADLSHADLSKAILDSMEQLSTAKSLSDATLPD